MYNTSKCANCGDEFNTEDAVENEFCSEDCFGEYYVVRNNLDDDDQYDEWDEYDNYDDCYCYDEYWSDDDDQYDEY